MVPYNEELSLSVNRAHSDALFSRYLLFKSILAANDTRVRHGPFLSMRLPTDIKVKMMNNPGPSQAVTPEMLGYLPRVGLFYGRYSYEYGKSALALKEMRNSITMECPLCRVEIFDAGHIIEADASVEFVEKIVDILLK